MAQGYLVTLGDTNLDTGDSIGGAYTTFTTDTYIGTGTWVWSGNHGGSSYSNFEEAGDYTLGDDGNLYFIPHAGPVDFISSGSASSIPSYSTLDGSIDGTDSAEVINSSFVDDDGDQIDNGLGGGDGNNDLVLARGGDDTVDAESGSDTVYGGAGADDISGGAGHDVLYGDSRLQAEVDGSAQSIDASNVTDTSSGFTVKAQKLDGSLSADNLSYNSGGFGVIGAVSDTDSGVTEQLGYDKATGVSEKIFVDFDYDITEASFSFRDLYSDMHGEEGHWAVYNDGVLVAEADFSASGGATSGTVTINGVGAFDRIVFSSNIQTNLTDGSDYLITDITFTTPVIDPDPYNDTIDGGAGDDAIYGEGGDDSLIGGLGADTLDGGAGDDTLVTAQGDTATGGDGDDYFEIVDVGDSGSGTIAITGGDDGQTFGDVLDFNGQLSPGTLTITSVADDGSLSGTATLLDGTTVTFSGIESVVCFVAGTRIDTPNGSQRVENLRPGDLVQTQDHGYQPIVWIGESQTSGIGPTAPVCIDRAYSGTAKDLLVSPQHKMLHRSSAAEMLFGTSEVLIPAVAMIDGTAIYRVPCAGVSYFHLMTPQHDIVFADGLAAESFFPGPQALSTLSRSEHIKLMYAMASHGVSFDDYGTLARRCLTAKEYKLLCQYNPPELTVPKFALGPNTAVPPVDVVTWRP